LAENIHSSQRAAAAAAAGVSSLGYQTTQVERQLAVWSSHLIEPLLRSVPNARLATSGQYLVNQGSTEAVRFELLSQSGCLLDDMLPGNDVG
jgi:hypothetical protein